MAPGAISGFGLVIGLQVGVFRLVRKGRWTNEQQDVGRTLRQRTRRHHGGDQRLHRLRQASSGARTSRGSLRPCAHAGEAGHHASRRTSTRIASGLEPIASRDRGRRLHVLARARGHPHERRGAAAPSSSAPRPAGCTPRARATTRSRPTCGSGSRDAIDQLDGQLRELQRSLADKALAHRRRRDAGLHAPAVGAAGDLRPPSAGLCRDARPRPRPLRRRAQAHERVPARRRGAGRHVVSRSTAT